MGLAELVEFGEPNLADAELNLLQGVVSHGVGDEFGVDLSSIVALSSCGNLIKELAEVNTNGEIDQHVLVKRGVIITLNWLNVLKLREAAEGVGSAHELFKASVALKTFNNEHHVVDLVTVEHHGEELAEGVNGLAGDELNLLHQLFLHGLAECSDFEVGGLVLVQEDIGSVVSVFQNQLEFTDVGSRLELSVD